MTLTGRERVCINGFCATSREWSPWFDDRYEIWTLNRSYIYHQRSDRHFDLHSGNIRGWKHRRPTGHLQFLQTYPGPVVLHEVDPEIPNSVRYPFEEVTADLGQHLFRLHEDGSRTDCLTTPYLDSSIAYELALAIHEGFKEIMVTGVDLNTQSEYVWQRSGVSHLLGIAAGRGIDVVLPDNCPLLTGPLYGRGYLAESGEHMSPTQLEDRFNALRVQMEETLAELHRLQGQEREISFVLEQMIPGIDHEKVDQRRNKIRQAIAELTAKAQACEGSLNETQYWIHQTPDGMSQDEARRQIERDLKVQDVKVNGYQHFGGEELSEGDLSEFARLEETETPVPNGTVVPAAA